MEQPKSKKEQGVMIVKRWKDGSALIESEEGTLLVEARLPNFWAECMSMPEPENPTSLSNKK